MLKQMISFAVVLGLVLALASAAQADIVSDLVMRYEFDDSGNVAKNSVGPDGTNLGVTLSADVPLGFAGTSGDFGATNQTRHIHPATYGPFQKYCNTDIDRE